MFDEADFDTNDFDCGGEVPPAVSAPIQPKYRGRRGRKPIAESVEADMDAEVFESMVI